MKTLANEPRLKFPFYCKNNQSIMLSKLGIKGLSALVKRIWFIRTTAAPGNVDGVSVPAAVYGREWRKKHIDTFFFSYALFCRVFSFPIYSRVTTEEPCTWIKIVTCSINLLKTKHIFVM